MDNKSKLNIYCQQNKIPTPEYEISNPEGKSHSPIFKWIKISTKGVIDDFIIYGDFKNKKDAEYKCAELFLEKIKKNENINNYKDDILLIYQTIWEISKNYEEIKSSKAIELDKPLKNNEILKNFLINKGLNVT